MTMKRSSLLLLVISSLLIARVALSEDRAHYGGMLRVELRESPQSLDHVALNTTALQSLSCLVFETLVSLDDQGRPHPLLATSWQAEPGDQRWRFQLRSGVFFSNGVALDAAAVAASLRSNNSNWKVMATDDVVLIETDKADPYLPAELALARNSVVRLSGDALIGTGPFTIAQWGAGQGATFKANEQYWGGRPFLASIQVEFGKNDREQLMALELGKADVVEMPAENIRRAEAENKNVIARAPSELIALLFASEPRSDDEAVVRRALAASIDRASVSDVVMQGGGEPASSLLPEWLSGYGFVFANSDSVQRSALGQKRSQKWSLAFDSADAIARIIAQRIVLNARDAGITLDVNATQSADVKLVRVSLDSDDPHVALIELAKALQLPIPSFENESVTELYSAERVLLQSRRVIPLVHARSAVAIRTTVHEFKMFPHGGWRLDNVWLATERP
jgi:peptide/nickel transport system substrate-binding protein